MSLVAMLGMLALVVDLGWAFFVKKAAQRAADAASLAAAIQALGDVANGLPQCGVNVACQAATPCPSTIATPPASTVMVACLYAAQNGFRTGGAGGTQTVTVAADTVTPPPTAPGVNSVQYWITVRVTQVTPVWFGSVLQASATGSRALGEGSGTAALSGLPVAFALRGGGPGARATGAITEGTLGGTLFLVNRQNDPSGIASPGVNLTGGGSPIVTAPGGMIMASLANGTNNPYGVYAGMLQGSPVVTSPSTSIRGAGTVDLGGSATWQQPPVNGFPDGALFNDPMSGKGQPPPLPAGGQTNYVAVPNGCLDCLVPPLLPGQYYAVDSKGKPTGGLLTAKNSITFTDGGNGFGNYVFYGGLQFPSTQTTATFYPGRYVLAGTQSGNDIISYHTQVYLRDLGTAGVQNTDAGEIFIFTDPGYPGLAGNLPPALVNNPGVLNSLGFGAINLQAGNNPEVGINLHGLNVTNAPSDLRSFAPTVFWQDQRNSYVKYNSRGYVDTTSCGAGHSLDSPCYTGLQTANSLTPGMTLQAHPNVQVYGLIYQPRGAWVTFQGQGSLNSAAVFISGALNLQGGATLGLLNTRDVLKHRMVMLVE